MSLLRPGVLNYIKFKTPNWLSANFYSRGNDLGNKFNELIVFSLYLDICFTFLVMLVSDEDNTT